jgi:hypothetical protein
MKRYLPEKIDIIKLIKDYPVEHIKGFHADKAIWILSEIAEKPCSYEGYVEIHSKRFRSFVHDYNDYLNYFSNISLIERNMQFYYDIFSKSKVRGYKFSEQYSSTLAGKEITYFPLIKKATKEQQKKLGTCRDNMHLVKWFNPNLTIDSDRAVDYLGIYYKEKRRESEAIAKKVDEINKTWYDDYSEKYFTLQQHKITDPYESYRKAFISIDEIKEHDYHLSTDPMVNRFHSNLTCMPSDFRNFLKYDGKELVCLDIRNSQAFFSLSLLKKENIGEILNIANELTKRDRKFNNRKRIFPTNLPNPLSSSYILSESLQRIDNQEIELYRNLVLSGKIYDYYENILFQELGITYPSRKALKEEFFRTVFSSNRYFSQAGAAPKRVFQKYFPGIYEYFYQLKKIHHVIIPIVLQRWESYAVLQCITKKIAKNHLEVPLFSIHDGIATTKEYSELVSSVICEELSVLTGYSPALKKEEWNIKNLKYFDKWKHNQT